MLSRAPRICIRSETRLKRNDMPLRWISTWLLLVVAGWLANYSTSIRTRSLFYEVFLAEELGAILLLWVLWITILRKKGAPAASCEPACPPDSYLRDVDEDSADPFFGVSDPKPFPATRCGDRYRARRALRRHLHRTALEDLQKVIIALGGTEAARESHALVSSRPRPMSRLAHLHKGVPSDTILSGEAATYRYAPDIAEHLQRLMEDRSSVIESGIGEDWLTPILE